MLQHWENRLRCHISQCTITFLPPLMSLWGSTAFQWAAHALSGRYKETDWGSGWNSARRPFHWHRRVGYWCLKEASAKTRNRFKSHRSSLKKTKTGAQLCISYLTHLFKLTHGQSEKCNKLLLILAYAHTGNLCQALQCHIAKHWHIQKLKTDKDINSLIWLTVQTQVKHVVTRKLMPIILVSSFSYCWV